jgi:hypothetical protein
MVNIHDRHRRNLVHSYLGLVTTEVATAKQAMKQGQLALVLNELDQGLTHLLTAIGIVKQLHGDEATGTVVPPETPHDQAESKPLETSTSEVGPPSYLNRLELGDVPRA